MATLRSPLITLCGGIAVLACASVHAYTPAIYYQGAATAQDSGPYHAPSDQESATTHSPASYHAVSGANSAISTSDNAHGGSVYSTAAATTEVKGDGYPWAGGSGASALIAYNPYLTGSSGPVTPAIPIRVQASGYVDGSPSGEATASFNIRYFDGSPYAVTLSDFAQLRYDGSGRRTFLIDQVINILPDTEIDISISASASAIGPSDHPGSSWATAFVDPIFTIDPAYAADYKFVGLPPFSAVPEPVGLALLLPGLLAMAITRRRSVRLGVRCLRLGYRAWIPSSIERIIERTVRASDRPAGSRTAASPSTSRRLDERRTPP